MSVEWKSAQVLSLSIVSSAAAHCCCLDSKQLLCHAEENSESLTQGMYWILPRAKNANRADSFCMFFSSCGCWEEIPPYFSTWTLNTKLCVECWLWFEPGLGAGVSVLLLLPINLPENKFNILFEYSWVGIMASSGFAGIMEQCIRLNTQQAWLILRR